MSKKRKKNKKKSAPKKKHAPATSTKAEADVTTAPTEATTATETADAPAKAAAPEAGGTDTKSGGDASASGGEPPKPRKSPVAIAITLGVAALLPVVLGKPGVVFSTLIVCGVLGVPIFAMISAATFVCFLLFTEQHSLNDFSRVIERSRSLADEETLLAIPFFLMSGNVMAKGKMSERLVEFARALVGFLPGGLAISAVIACILFAAISGSSPATVVAVGAMVGPTLVESGYGKNFSHGLLASAGSLGILIPPSIPMLIYPIVFPAGRVEVERLFAAGFGPGLMLGAIFMGACVVQGVRMKTERTPFRIATLGTAFRDGFWALMFPVFVLGGIYGGLFSAVEAAAISVVYAIVVEVFIHGALRMGEIPGIVQETGIFLGSLLVVMVGALFFTEFLILADIPNELVAWLEGLGLEPWQFFIVLNLMLLAVGMAMDIISAMFVFVPLLGPMAVAMGMDPVHFGVLFIVNLEIGYLTPPVGLNLFVASALFERPIGAIVRGVAPFIVLMLVGLALITRYPQISVGMGDAILGIEPAPVAAPRRSGASLEEMMNEAGGDEEDEGGGGSLEEMMREAGLVDEDGEDDDGDGAGAGGMPSMEEMMRQAELEDEEDVE